MLAFFLLAACTQSDDPSDPANGDPGGDPPADTRPDPEPGAGGGTVSSVETVVINEIQASNRSTWQETATWGFPDWVELYNAGTEPVALRDLSLQDGSGETWRGPDEGTLAPGEHLFLAADGVEEDFVLPFSLASDGGDTLYLAIQGAPADIVAIGTLEDDLSLGRFPDGQAWLATARPTPGWTNGSAPSATLDPADDLFKAYEMHEIAVTVPRSDYDDIDARIPTDCEVVVDGIYFPGAQIKNTGQGSWDTMSGKPRLVLNLDARGDTTREFRGVDNLELHNGKTADATRARDWVTYEYFRLAGVPASRVGFAHVTVNGDDYGLYVLVENMDDKWIEARFPASKDTGMLFEAGDIGGSGIGAMEYESGPTPAWAPTVEVMQRADDAASGASTDEALAQLWTGVPKEAILDYIAIEGISNHWDGYDSPHNYRFYADGVSHLTYLVPSGVEITWTGDPELWTSNGNLAGFCFDNPTCKREYAERVLLLTDLLESEGLADQYEAVFDWLLPYIDADPRKFATTATARGVFESSLTNLQNNGREARQDVYDVYPDLEP